MHYRGYTTDLGLLIFHQIILFIAHFTLKCKYIITLWPQGSCFKIHRRLMWFWVSAASGRHRRGGHEPVAAWYFICSLVYKKDSQLVVRNYCRFKFNRQALLSHSIDQTLQLVSTVSRVATKQETNEEGALRNSWWPCAIYVISERERKLNC